MKRRLVVGLALTTAFAFSGMALAATDGQDDTVINSGYDEDSHFWILNVTSLEYSVNEEEPETDGLAVEEDFETLLEDCGLEAYDDEGNPVEYDYLYDGETLTLTGPDGGATECGEWYQGSVEGPAGQVNHGMFLKHFNEWYQGENRGCIVRHIAGSEHGMGDQQVIAGGPDTESDESEAPTEEMSDEEGTVSFTTFPADCQKGPDKDGVGGEEDDQPHGPPQHVLDKWGQDGPGKSGSAGKGRP